MKLEEEIQKYLTTIRYIGNTAAQKIVDVFGKKSIDILKNNPELVSEKISGIGKKTAYNIRTEILKCGNDFTIYMKLLPLGFSENRIKKLINKEHPNNCQFLIVNNPYIFIRDDFSFAECDKIAHSQGFDAEDKSRIMTAITEVIKANSQRSGDCYIYQHELIPLLHEVLDIKISKADAKKILQEEKANTGIVIFPDWNREFKIKKTQLRNYINYGREFFYLLYSISNDVIYNIITEMTDRNILTIVDGTKIYRSQIYDAEEGIAQTIFNVDNQKKTLASNSELEKRLDTYLTDNSIQLEEKQRQAVLKITSCQGGFFVLIGAAGCGKTFTIKVILDILKGLYQEKGLQLDLQMLAPTGKAAHVAEKESGYPCETIHKGLGYNGESFMIKQLHANCIIVDEASMLGVDLTWHLLQAVKPQTKVIFLGDTHQLPSISAGNVLHDIIKSGLTTVIELDTIKRQESDSGIIYNAHNIIAGKMIQSCPKTADAFFVQRNSAKGILYAIAESMHRLINRYHYSFNDVQVICPQKKTLVGTEVVNALLQKELNPNSETGPLWKTIEINNEKKIPVYYRKGDKVINLRNNYRKPLYTKNGTTFTVVEENAEITNGECGIIDTIEEVQNPKSRWKKYTVCVQFENGYRKYQKDIKDLDLAYAITVHKSQGSQWPAVLIPVSILNYYMLSNNLLYTAWTRSMKFVAAIGDAKAVNKAITTHREVNRKTGLIEQLRIYKGL